MNSKIVKYQEKLKEVRKENRYLRKRVRGLKLSREKWKSKYKGRTKELERSPLLVNKIDFGDKPKGHQYPSAQIELCLKFRHQANCSLRSCVKLLGVLSVLFGLNFRQPSPSSIRNWEIKLGYQRLKQECKVVDDWVLIIDESICIGNQKLLLSLGVNLGAYGFDKALSFEQVQVLGMSLSNSWKAESISKQIGIIEQRGYKIKYAVSDNGNNLRKSLRMSALTQIEDCTHALGKLMEKRYKNEERYKKFINRVVLLKQQINLSQFAVFIPPTLRAKGRFLNLSPLCKWAEKVLKVAQDYKGKAAHKQAFEKISWILDFKDLIEQIVGEQYLINQILSILKKEGLSEQSIKECHVQIDQSKVCQELTMQIKAYLKTNKDRLEKEEKIICCSDVIESIFGKFKNQVSSNPNVGITDSCLAIANFCNDFDRQEVKNAMQQVKIIDIEQWREKNLPLSLLQKKKRLFKSGLKKLA